LKALYHKGFAEQVFGNLLSQQKKHQKEQLLEDPAARSHNSVQVLLQAARKPRLVTCAESKARDSEESWRIIKRVAGFGADFMCVAEWGGRVPRCPHIFAIFVF
jgi:hypothetical protein